MKKAFGIVVTAVLLTATGSFAQESETDQAQPSEKKICKSEKMTGSLTRVRRTCMTKAQWDAVAEANRKAAGDFVRNSQNNQSVGRGQTLAAD